MTVQTTLAYDAIGANVGSLPKGAQVAGYSTGSGLVPWTAAQWAAHPGAVRIDQDPSASDGTADCLDVESGAATPSDCPGWVTRARASFKAATRKGQREPAVYVNESNIHLVADALSAAKITGVGLWVANWNLTETQAQAQVVAGAGPFPVVGIQYHSGPTFDTSVFSIPWLHNVSGKAPVEKHWKEWVSAGDYSLNDFAYKVADKPPSTLLRETAVHYGLFDPILAGYLNELAGGKIAATAKLPKGCKFWVYA